MINYLLYFVYSLSNTLPAPKDAAAVTTARKRVIVSVMCFLWSQRGSLASYIYMLNFGKKSTEIFYYFSKMSKKSAYSKPSSLMRSLR